MTTSLSGEFGKVPTHSLTRSFQATTKTSRISSSGNSHTVDSLSLAHIDRLQTSSISIELHPQSSFTIFKSFPWGLCQQQRVNAKIFGFLASSTLTTNRMPLPPPRNPLKHQPVRKRPPKTYGPQIVVGARYAINFSSRGGLSKVQRASKIRKSPRRVIDKNSRNPLSTLLA